MKLILILLFTLNAHAEFKAVFSSNESNVDGQHFMSDTEQLAKDKLIKIADDKKGWRKGEFTLVEAGSLYSKVFKHTEMQDLGNVQNVYSRDENGELILDENGDSIIIGTEPVLDEVEISTTKYYHPTNWSYSISDVTAEEQAKKDKEDADKAKIEELKLKDKAIKIDELVELLQLKGII